MYEGCAKDVRRMFKPYPGFKIKKALPERQGVINYFNAKFYLTVISPFLRTGGFSSFFFSGTLFGAGLFSLLMITTFLMISITVPPTPRRCAFELAGITCIPVGLNTRYSPDALPVESNTFSGT